MEEKRTMDQKNIRRKQPRNSKLRTPGLPSLLGSQEPTRATFRILPYRSQLSAIQRCKKDPRWPDVEDQRFLGMFSCLPKRKRGLSAPSADRVHGLNVRNPGAVELWITTEV